MVGKLGVSSIEKCAFCVRCHLWRDFMTIPKLSQNTSRLKLGESEKWSGCSDWTIGITAKCTVSTRDVYNTWNKRLSFRIFCAMLCAFYHWNLFVWLDCNLQLSRCVFHNKINKAFSVFLFFFNCPIGTICPANLLARLKSGCPSNDRTGDLAEPA